MGMLSVRGWLALVGMSSCGGALGCSLSRTEPDCQDHAECRDAFGTGYVCASSGLCEMAKVQPSCLNQYPTDLLLAPDKYKNYVIFGSLMRTTGKEGARQDAAYLAFDAFNRFAQRYEDDYPELEGLRFGFVQCDHEGDVNRAARLADYLSEQLGTPAIFGPATSSATLAAFTRVNLDEEGRELRRTLFMSPSASSVALTDLERQKPGLLWRTAPTDEGQGKLMANFVQEHAMPFIVLYEDTTYGHGLFDSIEARAGELCDHCGFSFDASSSDIDSLAATLAKSRLVSALKQVDTVFFIGAQEAHLKEMIRRMDQAELRDKLLFFSDSAASQDTISLLEKSNLSRVLGSRPKAANEGETLRLFSSIYEARYEESPLDHSFTTNAYDAAWMLLLGALHAVAVGEPITALSIADGLTKLSDPDWSGKSARDCPGESADTGCLPLSLDSNNIPAMLEAFQRFDRLDIVGASSDLSYDPKSEELEKSEDSFELWHVEPSLLDPAQYSIVSGPNAGAE